MDGFGDDAAFEDAVEEVAVSMRLLQHRVVPVLIYTRHQETAFLTAYLLLRICFTFFAIPDVGCVCFPSDT